MAIENYTPFGQRLGLVKVEDTIQLDELDRNFRVDLWNFFSKSAPPNTPYVYEKKGFEIVFVEEFLREPSENYRSGQVYYLKMREVILNGPWYRIYELIERFLNYFSYDNHLYKGLVAAFEKILINNNSGYRLINNEFVPISNKIEINEIELLSDTSLKRNLIGLKEHLDSSLHLISKKPVPDYRNSIKESISMVEAISRLIEPGENTLGKALRKLDSKRQINPTLISAFDKLYGYTNGEHGIRHALLDSTEPIDIEEARFFLVACSAFTNYLIEKAIKFGVIS